MAQPRRNPDANSTNKYDAPKPRLVSLRQERHEKKVRDELSGDAHKREVSKITLPKFSWDKES